MGIFILKFQSTLDSYKYQSLGSGGPSEWSATWEEPATIVTCCSWDYGYAISTTSISWDQVAKKTAKFSQCQDTGGKDPDPSIPVMPRDFQVRYERKVVFANHLLNDWHKHSRSLQPTSDENWATGLSDASTRLVLLFQFHDMTWLFLQSSGLGQDASKGEFQ